MPTTRYFLLAATTLLLASCPILGEDRPLIDLNNLDPDTIRARDAKAEPVDTPGGKALRVTTEKDGRWPGVTLLPEDGRWDLSTSRYIAVELRNLGEGGVQISCRVDSSAVDGSRNSTTGRIDLAVGETKTLRVDLVRRLPAPLADKLFGTRGYPEGYQKDTGLDPARIAGVTVFVSKPAAGHVFQIERVRSGGSFTRPPWIADPEKLFPLIDRYGQYMHKDWPGKTHGPEDLARHKAAEAADLAANPGAEDRDQYGGWTAGPKLEATGFFRAEKLRGKWWLVDPEGRLFWSHGIDCVRSTTGYTPITDREHYFETLPAKDSPLGQFYGRGNWAPHGYYQGKGPYETYNFTGANLLRKYGDDWQRQFAELCHTRLRSWGLNTIGNWSDPEIYRLRKTPYVATVGSGRKPIEGSSGYWGKFPDPFDTDFRETTRRNMARERDTSAGDPWCLGYFVDNELAWGDELSLAVAALASPPGQAAKRVFVEDLKKEYGTIAKLNAAWGTDHASWDALLESTTPPDRNKARDDLAAFYTRLAEAYFRVCREAVKEAAPNQLYLGCRFAWVNDRAVRAAAKHCDVIGFNRYRDTVADFRLPEGVDKPAIIGEFHFGALDRGMFHTGLRPVKDQKARAAAYRSYVTGALENPWLVGTHWFQYGDQATTGRGDGENYQIGFLDICDTPYPETIRAARQVARQMYKLRWGER